MKKSTGTAILGVLVGVSLTVVIHGYLHRESIWDDQIKNHGCQVFTYWNDGYEKRGDLCRLPDGTILRHTR